MTTAPAPRLSLRHPCFGDLWNGAKRHLEEVHVPRFVRLHGGAPKWSILGHRVNSLALHHHTYLLTPIMVVGRAALGRELPSLLPSGLQMFGYLFREPVYFDADVFEAGLAAARMADDCTVDLTPIASRFAELLPSLGLLPIPIHEAGPNERPWSHLRPDSLIARDREVSDFF